MEENEKKTMQTMYEGNKYGAYAQPFYYLILVLFILYGGVRQFLELLEMQETENLSMADDTAGPNYELLGKWALLAIMAIAVIILTYRIWIRVRIIRSSLKK